MKRRFFLVIACAMIVLGCATVDFSKVQISKIDLSLSESFREAEKIVPGGTYQVLVAIYDDAGRELRWKPGQVSINSPNSTFQIEDAGLLGLYVKAASDTLRLANGDVFRLEVGVQGNTFPARTRDWPVDWDRFDTLIFKGDVGRDGRDGEPGRDGNGGVEATIDGSDGKDGENGGNGQDGRDTTIVASYYLTVDSQKLLLLYSLEEKKPYLSRVHQFTINASGGDGGKGGRGGDAGKGAESTAGDLTSAPMAKRGRDGDAGNGGGGGNGGDAGTVTIWYCDPLILDLVVPAVKGGQPGKGGESGKPGLIPSRRGRDGRQGSWGRDGASVAIFKPYEEIARFFQLASVPGLDVSRILAQ